MKQLNEQQHHIVEVLLGMQRPVTARELVGVLGISETLIKNRLDTLVNAGWLTKGKAPVVAGKRGVPPSEYALIAGARNKWEASLQRS